MTSSPGLGDREDRVHERHVAAGRHHHAAAARDVDAVVAPQLVLDRVDQRAVAGAVLIAVRLGVGQRVARAVRARLGGGP